MKTKVLCIYHANCADGFGAALACHLWCQLNGFEMTAAPCNYGDEPPAIDGYHHIYILDFSFSRAVVEALYDYHKEQTDGAGIFHIIDHHESAEKELSGLAYAHYDMNHSGAVLAYQHFFPGYDVPMMFRYIEDRDLWRWEMHLSKEFSAGLKLELFNFERWAHLAAHESHVNWIRNRGAVVLEYQQQHIDAVMGRPKERIKIAGYDVPVVNTTTLVSEIGNELCKGEPFAAMYFETDSKRVYSLRSDCDNPDSVNVAEVATRYGGGGHRHAAGFTVDKSDHVLEVVS